MAAIKPERVFQPTEELTRALIAVVGEPVIGLK
jgi:hypothetical protein